MNDVAIENLPSFQGLLKGLRENLDVQNFYVREFMPDAVQSERDKDGRKMIFELSDAAREKLAKEQLLDDNGNCFDEFIHEDKLRGDVTEFMRDIVKILYRQGDI